MTRYQQLTKNKTPGQPVRTDWAPIASKIIWRRKGLVRRAGGQDMLTEKGAKR